MPPRASRPGVRGARLNQRRQRPEDGIEVAHGARLAADHLAETALQPMDATAGPHVHVADAPTFERPGPANVVTVVRIAAVDDDIAVLHGRRQVFHDRIDRGRGHHDPGGAWLGKLRHEILGRVGAGRAVLLQASHGGGIGVIDDARMPVAHEPPDHVGAHAPQTDHSKLHLVTSSANPRPPALIKDMDMEPTSLLLERKAETLGASARMAACRGVARAEA